MADDEVLIAPDGFPAAASPYASEGAKSSLLSIVSLVAGIVGFAGGAISFIPSVGSALALPIPIAAIIFGFLGRRREPHAVRILWNFGTARRIHLRAVVFSGSPSYDVY